MDLARYAQVCCGAEPTKAKGERLKLKRFHQGPDSVPLLGGKTRSHQGSRASRYLISNAARIRL